MIWGVVNYFDPFSLVHNEEPIKDVPSGFYMTDYITSKSIDLIDQFSKDQKPFFLYIFLGCENFHLWSNFLIISSLLPFKGFQMVCFTIGQVR